jgi:hypothetical protein
MQGEAWEFASKGRKKGAACRDGGAPSTQERLRGGSQSSTYHESGSSKAADRLSNRTAAYFMKATSHGSGISCSIRIRIWSVKLVNKYLNSNLIVGGGGPFRK